jgi:hypothetical protein
MVMLTQKNSLAIPYKLLARFLLAKFNNLFKIKNAIYAVKTTNLTLMQTNIFFPNVIEI